jgi:hypothetical protein
MKTCANNKFRDDRHGALNVNMLRPTTRLLSRSLTCIQKLNVLPPRSFSTSQCLRTDPFPSVLEDVNSPLEITSVLRSGKGIKIRTLQDPSPHTIHGNIIILDGEYFLWRPQLQWSQSGVLDISTTSWGILDVITPKPGTHLESVDIEILILGTGDRVMLVQKTRETLAKMGIQVDVQDTVCIS